MYLAYRRCAILATVIATYITKGDSPNKVTCATTFLYVFGSLVAGYEQMDSDAFGFAVVWGCNFLQSFSNVAVDRLNREKVVNSFDISFYFSALGIIVLTPYIFYSGNNMVLYNMFSLGSEQRQTFIYLFTLSSVSGLIITIFSLLVVALGGPIAMNITGNVRDVGLTYIGFILFDDI